MSPREDEIKAGDGVAASKSPLKPTGGLHDGGTLSALVETAIREIAAKGQSANTQRAYQNAIGYWVAWYGLRYGKPMEFPVSAHTVVLFIADHATGECAGLPVEIENSLIAAGVKKDAGPMSLATLMLRLSALSTVHRMSAIANPCLSESVRKAISRAKREYAIRSVKTKRKDPLTIGLLSALVATCDDSPVGIRDQALLLVAWASGGRRCSEVVQILIEDVRKIDHREYLFSISRCPSDDQEKPLVEQAADALEKWLVLLTKQGHDVGPIFRRLSRTGHAGRQLAPSAVRDIVVRRVKLAGLLGHYSAHSIRSGFLKDAARSDFSLTALMDMTGLKSASSFNSLQLCSKSMGRAARLFKTA